MPEIELSAGVLEYDDAGAAGPVVVLLNGLLIGRSVWRSVVADLAVDHRCLVLELPLGAHRRPMRDDADLSGRGLAGLLALALQQMRIRPIRRSPLNFGLMSKRPVPDTVMDAWLRPAISSARIRRDVLTYLRATRKGEYLEAAASLPGFTGPALVVWAPEDRLMRPDHGRRLVQQLPDGRLAEVTDSYTLIPEDQPQRCAELIRAFIAETSR
ncbi:alpha/beta hydrolase [Actinoplanes sp. NBC_00393]|uniref:alpha/beta fold hydrolase n=1 Tax=Actinoplanes sp. NBC_00393 TaxID=2975953 RepID=UPI002E1FEB2A